MTCPTCYGAGKITHLLFGIFQWNTTCPSCSGYGFLPSPKIPNLEMDEERTGTGISKTIHSRMKPPTPPVPSAIEPEGEDPVSASLLDSAMGNSDPDKRS